MSSCPSPRGPRRLMSKAEVPTSLQKTVYSHVHTYWAMTGGLDNQRILAKVPAPLKGDILEAIHQDLVRGQSCVPLGNASSLGPRILTPHFTARSRHAVLNLVRRLTPRGRYTVPALSLHRKPTVHGVIRGVRSGHARQVAPRGCSGEADFDQSDHTVQPDLHLQHGVAAGQRGMSKVSRTSQEVALSGQCKSVRATLLRHASNYQPTHPHTQALSVQVDHPLLPSCS